MQGGKKREGKDKASREMTDFQGKDENMMQASFEHDSQWYLHNPGHIKV